MALTSGHVEKIVSVVAALDQQATVKCVESALLDGMDSIAILRAVQEGLQEVGFRYQRRDIYLSGLIMAGQIFRSVSQLVQPEFKSSVTGDGSGRVLLGTVAGDIHDIGKDMVALAFRTYGFEVQDLGVNVPPEQFVGAAVEFSPDVIALSGLLTVAFNSMRKTVALLKEKGPDLTPKPITIIGGGTIDQSVATYVGADYWTTDAMDGLRICQHALEAARLQRHQISKAGVRQLIDQGFN